MRKAVAFLGIGLGMIGTAWPTSAAVSIYDCGMNLGASSAWIAPEIVLTLDETNGTATVLDAIVTEFVGKPIPAKSRYAGDLIIVEWVVRVETDRRQKARMTYRLAFPVDGGVNGADMTARPDDYDSIFTAFGTCLRRDG